VFWSGRVNLKDHKHHLSNVPNICLETKYFGLWIPQRNKPNGYRSPLYFTSNSWHLREKQLFHQESWLQSILHRANVVRIEENRKRGGKKRRGEFSDVFMYNFPRQKPGKRRRGTREKTWYEMWNVNWLNQEWGEDGMNARIWVSTHTKATSF